LVGGAAAASQNGGDLSTSGANVEETGFTLEGRVLCGDDACIGTIGPDKRCRLCGKPYEGDAELGSEEAPRTAPEGDGERPDAADAAPAGPAPVQDSGAPDGRTCCPDDACTGIIGPSGACGVCGKTRAP